ncbi:MAG: adhesin [Eubacteriales bacterium]|nr:adhesin [Eubacteriales bacterium]
MKYKKYLAVMMSAAVITTSAVPAAVFAESTTETENISEEFENSSEDASEKASEEEKALSEVSGQDDEGSENTTESDTDKKEKPNGEKPDGVPEKPNGEKPDGMPGDPGQGGPGGGADTQTYDYSGEVKGIVTADNEEVLSEGAEISSEESDVNALLAQNGGSLVVKDSTITKFGDDDNGDNCNFYGVNSIALSTGENSQLKISDATLSSDSTGSNAIFATDNATAYASNTTIITSKDNSRGLDATYGGTIVADSVKIQTSGDHSASIATDRGGGSISVTNSTLNTEGSGSPLLYSTGNIEVNSVTGTASGSQIAGMEGLNTILISNSDLSSSITEATASDPLANGVIIYQSTSGDAETSTGDTARFQVVDSTLTSSIDSGAMFYVTNTTADILLSGTTLNFDSTNTKLLQIEGNDSNNWGKAGSNGGTVTFTALGETLDGDISVDTISSLDLYLLDATTYTGSTEITENEENTDAKEKVITVNIDADSTWVVMEDSTVNVLNAEEGAQIIDKNGKTVKIVANGETVVEGNSDITLTVTDSCGDTVTTDESNTVSDTSIERADFDNYYGTSTVY